jgi:hypothetical protein
LALQAFPASEGGTGGGIPEAPIDGKQYGRQDATWTEVTGGGSSLSKGSIIMWSDPVVPEGWQICDGTNNTPDLRDKFVVGAGSNYNLDSSGGSADAVVVSHGHSLSGTADSNGAHTHSIAGTIGNTAGSTQTNQLIKSNDTSYSMNTNSDGAHTHSVSGNASDTGVSGTNKNLPPYYSLYYIMKMVEGGGGSGGDSIWTDVDGDAVLETDGKKLTIDANVAELGAKARITTDTNLLEFNVGSGSLPDVTIADSGFTYSSSADTNITAKANSGRYATYMADNGDQKYAMQIRPDQANAFVIRNETSGQNSMSIATDGKVVIPTGNVDITKVVTAEKFVSTTGETTTNAPNVHMTAGGSIVKSTGSSNIWSQTGSDVYFTNNSNGLYINTAQPNSVNLMNYNGSNFGDIWLRGTSSPDRGVGVLGDGRVMIPDVLNTPTGLTPNLAIQSDGQLMVSTVTSYSKEEVDGLVNAKEDIINKLTQRLDSLELKFKALK